MFSQRKVGGFFFLWFALKKNGLQKMQRGRPLMLGTLDEKVKNILTILRRKGGVVNTVVAIATAQALKERSQDEHLKCIDLESSSWAKSLFKRMGFVKRTCTTSKPEIPEQAMKEAKLIFQHQIVNFVEQYTIPPPPPPSPILDS